MSTTQRGYPGERHLFPAVHHGPYCMSLQGSRHHASRPREDLAALEDYEAVEMVISDTREDFASVHPSDLALDEAVCRYFKDPGDDSGCVNGAYVPLGIIQHIEKRHKKPREE